MVHPTADMELPLRKDLKPKPGQPIDTAWIWGPDDELGRLNLQTPDRVIQAMSATKYGEVISLNLSLDIPDPPTFGRSPFKHDIIRLDKHAFDETYDLNPQCSSQWDGFRHFAHVSSELFYNGTKAGDIQGPHASFKCGMQAWSRHGIAGRGVLLDYGRWAEDNHVEPVYYDNYKISYADLVKVAKSQGIDLRPASQGGDIQVADILIIRSGFQRNDESLSAGEREAYHLRPAKFGPDDPQRCIGLEQSDEILDFLHDCYFSAVAGDQPAFEAWPSDKDYYLHEKLLALWGVPIGEYWDLEKLGERCAARKQWTFFLTSAPMNVKGGVGSTANALAIL